MLHFSTNTPQKCVILNFLGYKNQAETTMNESVSNQYLVLFKGLGKKNLKIWLGKEKQQKLKYTTDEDELRSHRSEVIAPTSL